MFAVAVIIDNVGVRSASATIRALAQSAESMSMGWTGTLEETGTQTCNQLNQHLTSATMDRPSRARTAPRRFTDGTYDDGAKQPKALKSKAQQQQSPARSSGRSRKATQRYDPEDDDGYEAPRASGTKNSKSGKTTGKKQPKRPTNAKKVSLPSSSLV